MAYPMGKAWPEPNQLTDLLRRRAVEILEPAANEDDNPESLIIKKLDRLRGCGYSNGDLVFFYKTPTGRTSRSGIQRCGLRFCPRCIGQLASKDFRRIADTMKSWIKRGKRWKKKKADFLFVTLTIPHDRVDLGTDATQADFEIARLHWAECDRLLAGAWSLFCQHFYTKLKIPWVSFVMKYEVTLAVGGGYHHHIHAVAFTDTKLHTPIRRKGETYSKWSRRVAEASKEISIDLIERWVEAIDSCIRKEFKKNDPIEYFYQRIGITAERYQAMNISETRELIKERFLPFNRDTGDLLIIDSFLKEISVDGEAKEIELFQLKGAATAQVMRNYDDAMEQLPRYFAAEMGNTHTKTSKKFDRLSWLDGLEHFHNEDWFKSVYRHLITSSHRRRLLQFGRVKSKRTGTYIGFDAFLLGDDEVTKQVFFPTQEDLIGEIPREKYIEAGKVVAGTSQLLRAMDEYQRTQETNHLLNIGLTPATLQSFSDQAKKRHRKNALRLLRNGHYASPYVIEHSHAEVKQWLAEMAEIKRLTGETDLKIKLKSQETARRKLAKAIGPMVRNANSLFKRGQRRPSEYRDIRAATKNLLRRKPDEILLLSEKALKVVTSLFAKAAKRRECIKRIVLKLANLVRQTVDDLRSKLVDDSEHHKVLKNLIDARDSLNRCEAKIEHFIVHDEKRFLSGCEDMGSL
jgi:hypothetical protein